MEPAIALVELGSVAFGVRTGDALDRRKLVSFVEAIRRISA